MLLLFAVAAFIILAMPHMAWASTTMPYDTGVKAVQSSLTGPVAGLLALVGIAAAGGTLIFGGDLNGFVRTICLLVLVAGILVGAASLLTAFGLTPGTGAMIAQSGSVIARA